LREQAFKQQITRLIVKLCNPIMAMPINDVMLSRPVSAFMDIVLKGAIWLFYCEIILSLIIHCKVSLL